MRKIKTVKDEEKIYAAQDKEIERVCGKEAADNANSGWFVDDYTITTKIYLDPRKILMSWLVGNTVIHSWEE